MDAYAAVLHYIEGRLRDENAMAYYRSIGGEPALIVIGRGMNRHRRKQNSLMVRIVDNFNMANVLVVEKSGLGKHFTIDINDSNCFIDVERAISHILWTIRN